ncbi:MAG: hypothetical protein ACUVSU_00780 [Aggregatilineaceae bacterium]
MSRLIDASLRSYAQYLIYNQAETSEQVDSLHEDRDNPGACSLYINPPQAKNSAPAPNASQKKGSNCENYMEHKF